MPTPIDSALAAATGPAAGLSVLTHDVTAQAISAAQNAAQLPGPVLGEESPAGPRLAQIEAAIGQVRQDGDLFSSIISEMIVPALAADSAPESGMSPSAALAVPALALGGVDSSALLARAVEAFSQISPESGLSPSETLSGEVDMSGEAPTEHEPGSREVSMADLATRTTAASFAPPVPQPIMGAVPHPGSWTSAMSPGFLPSAAGVPTGFAPAAGGLSRSEVMDMVRRAKERIESERPQRTRSSSPGSPLGTRTSSSSSPITAGSGGGERAASPAIGRTVAGSAVDPAVAGGRTPTGLSAATPPSGSAGPAGPKGPIGGMGMMPMGGMGGGMGAAPAGGSMDTKDKFAAFKSTNPLLNGTWAQTQINPRARADTHQVFGDVAPPAAHLSGPVDSPERNTSRWA